MLENLSFENAILSAVAITTNSGGILALGLTEGANVQGSQDVLTIYSSFSSVLMALFMVDFLVLLLDISFLHFQGV